MPTVAEPKDWVSHRARCDEAARQFRTGGISQDVYSATLYGLGFRGREIQAEVNLNWPNQTGQ